MKESFGRAAELQMGGDWLLLRRKWRDRGRRSVEFLAALNHHFDEEL